MDPKKSGHISEVAKLLIYVHSGCLYFLMGRDLLTIMGAEINFASERVEMVDINDPTHVLTLALEETLNQLHLQSAYSIFETELHSRSLQGLGRKITMALT